MSTSFPLSHVTVIERRTPPPVELFDQDADECPVHGIERPVS